MGQSTSTDGSKETLQSIEYTVRMTIAKLARFPARQEQKSTGFKLPEVGGLQDIDGTWYLNFRGAKSRAKSERLTTTCAVAFYRGEATRRDRHVVADVTLRYVLQLQSTGKIVYLLSKFRAMTDRMVSQCRRLNTRKRNGIHFRSADIGQIIPLTRAKLGW